MLEVSGISKSFGSQIALQDVTLQIEEGECFGLVGPNGAGKTTLINLLCGLLNADSGEITLLGEKITRFSKKMRQQIGLVPQEMAIYENLSPLDNLRYFGELYGLKQNVITERSNELLKWVQLWDRRHERIKTLSTGMKRRVNIIAGLLHAPPLLLLDEPTVGVDPQARIFIYRLIEKLRDAGTTILYTTHYLPEVERLCKRLAILDEGNVVALGTKEELIEKAGLPDELEISIREQASEWVPQINDIFEKRADVINEKLVVVSAPHLWKNLSERVQQMDSAGIPISGMRLMPGRLESVFFQLTGKELRE